MSFQDLERGDIPLAPTAQAPAPLTRKLSINVHKIRANASGMERLVDLIGTSRDNADLRKRIHNLTEATRTIVKTASAELAELLKSESEGFNAKRVSSDFQSALEQFQNVQKKSVDKQRTAVERQKDTVETQSMPQSYHDDDDEQLQIQEQVQEPAVALDVEYQEQLIQEREDEIEQIEQGITELNQIFKDLAGIVSEQGDLIDNIESNVLHVAQDTRGASDQLRTAHVHQRRATRLKFCLFLLLLIVASIILLAVVL